MREEDSLGRLGLDTEPIPASTSDDTLHRRCTQQLLQGLARLIKVQQVAA
jgi:hypothetical protein